MLVRANTSAIRTHRSSNKARLKYDAPIQGVRKEVSNLISEMRTHFARSIGDIWLPLRAVRIALCELAIALNPGCSAEKTPPEATLSWLGPLTRPAKASGCAMPVLYSAPNSDYRQIAMVDVTADYDASDETVLGLLRQKACETGADAVIVVNNRRQTRGAPLPGYAAGEPDDVGPQSGANISERQHSPDLGEV